MSSEILSVLDYMEKEKGIAREDMISTIITAIRNAASKGPNAGQELKIVINPRNGHLNAWSLLTVVDSVSDHRTELHIQKARELKPDAQIGDVIEREIDPSHLGRIAASTARQAIVQRVRQFEKDRIYDEFKDSVGDIVSGIVRRRERGDLVVELGKAEALLPHREQIPGEELVPGDRVRCLLLHIESTNRGPEIILSRASPKFVRKLFDLEVTEIADGTVSIEAFAREPGYRTKIAVSTSDPKVDPVGACVGARGARVKSIVRELGGEKVDIIRFFSDPKEMVVEALKPAVPRKMTVDEKARRIRIEVAEEDLAVAIGRRGQNARLTARLINWKLDITKQESKVQTFDTRIQAATENLVNTLGIDVAIAERLVNMGLVSLEAFEGVEVENLVEYGFGEEEAAYVLQQFRKVQAG